MLKQRIITAVILVVFLLLALLNVNPLYWRAFITAAVVIAFWEWLRFCEIDNVAIQIASYLAFGACFYALQAGMLPMSIAIVGACLLWVALLLFIVSDALEIFHQKILKLVIGIVILTVAGWLIIEFKSIANGPWWIICFFVSVFAADVGAYFVGRRFGKTKLAPKVSPGKTVEGLLGGLALVSIIFTPILFSLFAASDAALILLVVLLTALVSVGGDLFESKLKRFVGLKDSSQILPGHGGVLDRIDSLLSGAPVFSLGLLMLGYLG
ncbi:MAG: phosphatidate cytidylyltransferase [Cryomorphaceae bacterium]|jgi:phosphatidate cytidylyltransferase